MVSVSDGAPRLTNRVHNAILDQIGERIVSGELAAGERIISADWGEEFGASRTAVREAVRVLESLGLVNVRRKAGITIQESTRWTVFAPEIIRWRLRGSERLRQLHEISELRAAIEPAAARLAASNASSDERDALGRAVAKMLENANRANSPEFLAADIAFHTGLLRASQNAMFAGLTSVIEEVLVGRTEHELMPDQANRQALELHSQIASAIIQHDGELAARAMTSIVLEADRAVQSLAQ